jgi:hypothetical protein
MSLSETDESVVTEPSTAPQDPTEGGDETRGEHAADVARGALKRKTMFVVVGVVLVAVLAIGAALIVFWPRAEAVAKPPNDFPSSEKIPLVEGEVVPSGPIEGNLSAVSVVVADHDGQKEALDRLADAGFLQIGESGSGPDGTVISLSRDDLSVRVEFGVDDNDQYTVTYTAAPRVTNDGQKEKGDSDASSNT